MLTMAEVFSGTAKLSETFQVTEAPPSVFLARRFSSSSSSLSVCPSVCLSVCLSLSLSCRNKERQIYLVMKYRHSSHMCQLKCVKFFYYFSAAACFTSKLGSVHAWTWERVFNHASIKTIKTGLRKRVL